MSPRVPRFGEATSVISPPPKANSNAERSIADTMNSNDAKRRERVKASFLDVYVIFEFTRNYDKFEESAASTAGSGSGNGKRDDDDGLKVDGADVREALFNGDTTFMLMGATGLAILLNLLLLFFIRKFPGLVIRSGPVLGVFLCLAAAGGLIYLQAWVTAAVLAVTGILLGASLWFMRHKFRLARDLLDTANKGAKKHHSVFWTVLIGLFVEGVISLWNLFTFVAVYLKFAPGRDACQEVGSCSLGLLITLFIFVLLTYLWVSSVVGNVIILTLAGGPYSTWWDGTDTKEKSESWAAFKKATSTSLGSVAFGSLLVGLVETLAYIIKSISLELCGSGLFTCCCFCFINAIEGLLELFNKYVYVKIGVDKFEHGFIPSAKAIVKLVKKRKNKDEMPLGVNAMITDCIVGFSLHTTCIACAIICTALTYVYTIIIDGTAKVDDWWDWVVLVYAFILVLNIGLVLTSALDAGVSTILFCLDKTPENLAKRNEQFYKALSTEESYKNYRGLLNKDDLPGEA
ncbi:hypothetical protein I302_102214 [Kwoniella bestiolae CBS 10118]|uniref:Protein PNS1 n=1 Tax=Kwoniella bestiolae CBS 10118 TaxID=1296100 RepID=A0AAJ8K361_9TREE